MRINPAPTSLDDPIRLLTALLGSYRAGYPYYGHLYAVQAKALQCTLNSQSSPFSGVELRSLLLEAETMTSRDFDFIGPLKPKQDLRGDIFHSVSFRLLGDLIATRSEIITAS